MDRSVTGRVHRGLAAALTVLALAFVGGCGTPVGDGAPPPLPIPPPPRSVPASTGPTVIGDPAGCPVPELRPVIERDIPMGDSVRIAELRILACRNDYAELLLVPENRETTDLLPIFLHHTGGAWTVVDWGGHIDCGYPEGIPDRTVAACRALGL